MSGGGRRGRGDAPSIDEVVENVDECLISVALHVPVVRWQGLRQVPAGKASLVLHRCFRSLMTEDQEQVPLAGVRSRDFIGEILRIKRLWTFHGKAAPGSLTACHSHALLTSAVNTCHRFRGSIQSPPRNSSHDSSRLIAGKMFGRLLARREQR